MQMHQCLWLSWLESFFFKIIWSRFFPTFCELALHATATFQSSFHLTHYPITLELLMAFVSAKLNIPLFEGIISNFSAHCSDLQQRSFSNSSPTHLLNIHLKCMLLIFNDREGKECLKSTTCQCVEILLGV